MKHFVIIIISLLISTVMFGQETYLDTNYIKSIDIELVKEESPADGLMEALYYYGVNDPIVVYSIAMVQTDSFKSDACVYRNNLFGLYDSKHQCFYQYNHWTDCVIAYKNKVDKRKRDNENYYEFLNRIKFSPDPRFTYKVQRIEYEFLMYD